MIESTANDDAYSTYYRHVELHWSLARECQIIVSPIEFEQIEKWYEDGVPLAVVLDGITAFIEKKRKAKRGRGFLLTAAASSVKKLFKDYQILHEGEGESGGDEDLLVSKMKKLIRKVSGLKKLQPEATSFLDDLVKKMKSIDLGKIVTYEDLDKELNSLEQEMLQYFLGSLPDEVRADIHEEVGELLSEDEDPEFYQKLVQDSIRSHYGLPRLTLLG